MPVEAEHIYMMEDHNQAYYVWRKAGLRNKILIHIDAHMDFAWFADSNPLSILESKSIQQIKDLVKKVKVWNPSFSPEDHQPDIGNYIYPAMKEGMFETFYWVVPDSFLDTAKKIRVLKRRIRRAANEIPGYRASVVANSRRIITSLLDCHVVVCCLKDLPRIQEAAILDIDTDFFITDFEREESPYLLQTKKLLPWIWPQELAGILREKGIKPALITIAYSVNKYFTPLEFKFLGDDLKTIFLEESVSADKITAMGLRREALMHKYGGVIDKAIGCFDAAIKFSPEDASSHYNLASLQYDFGLTQEARFSYHAAVCLDPAYGTRYNNLGEIYCRLGLYDKAEEEYRKSLVLDPENPHASCGMGELYFIKGKLKEARQALEQALLVNDNIHQARRLLAQIFIKENNQDQAIQILKEVISKSPGYLKAYLLLADIYMKQGAIDAALYNYKLALRLGFCDQSLYLRLGLLYAKNRQFSKAIKALLDSIRITPSALINSLRLRFEENQLLKIINSKYV